MLWNADELADLSPILDQIRLDLSPLDGKDILVLCSSRGEVPIWLAEQMQAGCITGLELNREALAAAQQAVHERGLDDRIYLSPADRRRIPLPMGSFDALVSEFILYPTPEPTEIGEPEMARVLKPGGRMVITDVIITRPLPEVARAALERVGLDYICTATPDDFCEWMAAAGLVNVAARDLTDVVRPVWERRREQDSTVAHQPGYTLLLDDSDFRLGSGIFYIYLCGEKPAQSR